MANTTAASPATHSVPNFLRQNNRQSHARTPSKIPNISRLAAIMFIGGKYSPFSARPQPAKLAAKTRNFRASVSPHSRDRTFAFSPPLLRKNRPFFALLLPRPWLRSVKSHTPPAIFAPPSPPLRKICPRFARAINFNLDSEPGVVIPGIQILKFLQKADT